MGTWGGKHFMRSAAGGLRVGNKVFNLKLVLVPEDASEGR